MLNIKPKNIQPYYSKSKLELNSKNVELTKIFRLYLIFLCVLKARLQVLKLEFCRIKLR